MTYLLALDQGTSSSRSIVFDASGQVVSMAQQELHQIYPQPARFGTDPSPIWKTHLAPPQARPPHAGPPPAPYTKPGVPKINGVSAP